MDQLRDQHLRHVRPILKERPKLFDAVKEATLHDPSKLETRKFAEKTQREFPVHTLDHACLSKIYAHMFDAPSEVKERIDKAIRLHGGEPEDITEALGEEEAADADTSHSTTGQEGSKENEKEENEENEKEAEDDPCWDGYKMVGTKQKDGKQVPDCVPKEESEDEKEDGESEKEGARQTSLPEQHFLLPEHRRLLTENEHDLKHNAEKLAAESDRLKFDTKMNAAQRTIKQAADYNVQKRDIPHRIYKLAGMTPCDSGELLDWVEARKVAAPDLDGRDMYEKIGHTIRENMPRDGVIRDRDTLKKVAHDLHRADQKTGLEDEYGRRLKDPIESVFNMDKVASPTVDLAGQKVPVKKLMDVSSEVYENVLGRDPTKRVESKSELAQVIRTLPDDSKQMLSQAIRSR